MILKQEDRFEIGGEDLLAFVKANITAAEAGTQEGDLERRQRQALDDIQVRVGTLLKAETVSFLLGAGASVECGGQLIGSVPVVIEDKLLGEGIRGDTRPRVRRWLELFYHAVRWAGAGDDSPVTRDKILERRKAIRDALEENEEANEQLKLKANFEQTLVTLYRWRASLPQEGGRLRIDGPPPLDAKSEDLDEALRQATRALAEACALPVSDKERKLESDKERELESNKERKLNTHKDLIRKLLTRPLNLKRVNIFTLNYDTLVEQAADAEGVVLLDGFVGTQRRVFRPECYDQDLYFPAETTEGRVHRFDRVLHLYKLHGSITWKACKQTIGNPYGVEWTAFEPEKNQTILIYPTPAKYGETLGMPYAELFRRFANAIVRPQSVLFVIGYGFGDEHVNAIIRQALAVPSFTIVIVDPSPQSKFVKALREQRDRRVWIAEGPTVGTLTGFVKHILPDLRDEEIRKKVLATHRALSKIDTEKEGVADGD